MDSLNEGKEIFVCFEFLKNEQKYNYHGNFRVHTFDNQCVMVM